MCVRPRLRDRFRAVPWLVNGAPRWLVAGVGAVLVGAGGFLLLRPLTAVQVLGVYVALSCLVSGVADLITPADRESRRWELITAALWLVAGISGLLWWGRVITLLAPAIGTVLILTGIIHVARLVRHRTWAEAIMALLGAAEVLLGVLALSWPDVTMIVVGALFGGRTVAFGLILLVRVLRGRTAARAERAKRPVVQAVLAVLLLVAAGGTTLLSHQLRTGAPVLDSFYTTPDTLPTEPGTLIRTAPYDAGEVPAGMTATRIYHTTTNAAGEIVPSSGLLVVPEEPAGPVPLVTWGHGTVGVARACAPSNLPGAFTPGQEPAVEQFAELGWGYVSSDYPGMGAEGDFPYLVGEGEGRAVLDAARAARQVSDVAFTDQTVIWGHSQGGHAALWAGQLADSYAPDLDIVGTAALSPASDPRAIGDSVLNHTDRLGASLAIAFVVESYVGYYSQLTLDEVAPPSGQVLIREAASRCTSQADTLVTVLSGLSVQKDPGLVNRAALDGRFGDLLTANIPTGDWSAPLFLGQGEDDEVIDFDINTAYVEALCADDVDVEFHGYPGGTHMSVLAVGSDLNQDLVAWTKDRLDGAPSTPNCS